MFLAHVCLCYNSQVTLSSSVKQICEQRFVSALKDLSSSKEMKSFELYNIVQHAKVHSLYFVITFS